MDEFKVLLSTLSSLNDEFQAKGVRFSQSIDSDLQEMSSLNDTVMNPLYQNLKDTCNRLKTGYTKCETWLADYLRDLTNLEDSLAQFKDPSLEAPLVFTGKFIQIFDQRVLPLLSHQESSNYNLKLGEINSGLSSDELNTVLKSADSQVGVTPYNTMTYGPDGGGFGCAMFVSYCYNQALFNGARGDVWDGDGFYGSTYEYWGNVTNDDYTPQNRGFKEVSAEEAKPGDVVCYTEGSDPYASHKACKHVALYTGDGQIVGSWGSGHSGPGVITGDVESQAYGYNGMRDIHYLHYVGEEK